jgi:uncharacterized protein YjbI with pentapeptide repeats
MSTGTKPSPEPSVSEIAREHQIWLDTKGQQGRQANFDGLNLWGIKFRPLIPTHNFTFATFGKAQLFRADLRGCTLQFANLHDTTGLSSDLLAGSDLTGAKLPELVCWSGELELLSSKASVAQSIFLAMLVAAIYIILTVIDTADLALITDSTTLSLPIINISVPVIPFYVVAPTLLCVIFVYFCFLQRETSDLLKRMPFAMPDGSLPATKAFSWLPSDAEKALGRGKSHRSLWGSAISAVVAYGTAPLALLCVWERGLVARYTKLTALHFLLFAVATSCCLYLLYFPARASVPRRHRKWAVTILATSLLAVAYLSLAVLKGGPPPRSEYLGSVLPAGSSQNDYDRSTYYYELNGPGSDDESAWAVPGRRFLHWLQLNPYPNLNRAKSALASSDSTDVGAGLSFPSGWTQPHLAAQNAQLQAAEMLACHLEGADLRRAVLSKTKLNDCHLEGATLSRAKIQKADFSGTHLDGAVLMETNLSGTDLSDTSFDHAVAVDSDFSNTMLVGVPLKNARFSGASMIHTNLTNADLTGAHMDGVDFTKSDLSSAHFDGADLDGATIESTSLSSATFKSANLTGASFARSDLTGSDLRCTDIGGASFSGADLSQARLTGMMNRSHHPGPYDPANFSVRAMKGADLYGANLVSATGLDAKKVKSALHWTEAFYSADLLQRLGLPANHNEQLEVQLSQEKFCQ